VDSPVQCPGALGWAHLAGDARDYVCNRKRRKRKLSSTTILVKRTPFEQDQELMSVQV